MAINWSNINSRINRVLELLKEQNFRIDVAWRLMQHLWAGLKRRSDLHLGVISVYWAKYILDHYILNGFNISPKAVLIEENYYSYLNLIEMNDANKQSGTNTYIVDFIADSTDLKVGEDLDVWMSANDSFKDTVKNIWMTRIAAAYINEGRLVTRKKGRVRIEDYWKHEDILYAIRVWDEDLNIIIIFLVGTYDNYPATMTGSI